jgi:hypothetical protein
MALEDKTGPESLLAREPRVEPFLGHRGLPGERVFAKFLGRRSRAVAALMIIGPLLLGAASADETAVRTTYKQLERAVRDGDGAAWLRLMDSATLAAMPDEAKQQWRSGRFRDASIRYDAISVRVVGNEAALIGKISSSQGGAHVQYHSLMLVREANEWKLATELYNNKPIEPAAVFALLPGRGGAFTLARTPWNAVAQILLAAHKSSTAAAPWNFRATRDEDSVYLRCELSKALPPPGTEINKPANSASADPGVPSVPRFKLKVAGAPDGTGSREYDLHIGAVVQTRATLDKSTGGYQNRYFVQYSLSVEAVRPAGNVDLFDNHTGDRFARLISVDRSSITVRLPLRALAADASARMTLEDANRPGGFSPTVIGVFTR